MRPLTREQLLKIFGLSSGAFDAQQRAGHVALAFGTPSPATPGRYCDLDLTALAIAEALAPTLGRPIATTIALGFFDRVRVVAAWCETRNDYRHFRTDRILSLDMTSDRYPRRRATMLREWRRRDSRVAALPRLC